MFRPSSYFSQRAVGALSVGTDHPCKKPRFPSLQSDDTTNVIKLLQGLIVVMAMNMCVSITFMENFFTIVTIAKGSFLSPYHTTCKKNPKKHRQISEPMAFLLENPGRSGRIR